MKHPLTPDKRYLVVRGRLWRAANPALPPEVRKATVDRLMTARRDVRDALESGDDEALARARQAVDEAKVALGERGPVWWTDGAPDFNRHLVKTARTPPGMSATRTSEESQGPGRKSIEGRVGKAAWCKRRGQVRLQPFESRPAIGGAFTYRRVIQRVQA